MSEPINLDARQAGFKRLAIPFIFAVLALVTTSLFNYEAVHTLVQDQRSRVIQRLIAVELQNLRGLARLAETGQRGFVITGQEEYLDPYYEARKSIPASISFLRKNFQSDRQQLERLSIFEQTIIFKLDELENSIEARRQSGFAAAQNLVLTNRGKDLMDELDELIRTIDGIERIKLDRLIQRSESSAEQAFTTIGIAGLLNVILLLVLLTLVRQDILTRQAAALQISEAQVLLRNVVDGSPAIISLKDIAGRFMLINKAFEKITGIDAKHIDGKTPNEIFSEATAKLENATDQSALEQGDLLQYEEKISTPEGERYFVTSKLPLRNHQGAIAGICAVSTDVTPLKNAESEVRILNRTLERRVMQRTQELAAVNAQLEDANGELEAFAYTVAHDLRAPLRSIQGFAEAVSEDYEDVLDKTGQDYLKRITRASTRMEGLIEDLLSFSRLSRMDIRQETVHLSEVLAEARANLYTQLADSDAELAVSPDMHTVHANRALCVQIFQNLLSNAIKFTHLGTRAHIRIWSELVQREQEADGSGVPAAYARAWVEDTGIGIHPDKIARIFRPFERLHGVDEYPGSGIGLAIVEKAARRMNGRCGVESIPLKGSRFWIELPVMESE